jgi:hypothetical protein
LDLNLVRVLLDSKVTKKGFGWNYRARGFKLAAPYFLPKDFDFTNARTAESDSSEELKEEDAKDNEVDNKKEEQKMQPVTVDTGTGSPASQAVPVTMKSTLDEKNIPEFTEAEI